MNCPVCKCPNPAGATHCSMCYEVFNRSAAQTYLQAIRRERRQSEEAPDDNEAIIKSQHVVNEEPSFLSKINWVDLINGAAGFVARFWKLGAALVALLVLGSLMSNLFSTAFWYRHNGKKFSYAFSDKHNSPYLVGMKQNIKIWSERQGRLDTPLDKQSTDEMGNLLFVKAPGTSSGAVNVAAKEWIQILNQEGNTTSKSIPQNHPSLAAGKILLDKQGLVLERRSALTPRLGKSLPFIALRFPKGSLKPGKTWTESIQWVDDYNGWKVAWSGTLHWSLGEMDVCGQNQCAEIRSLADLKPRLVDTPDWAAGAMGALTGKASASSLAQFDFSRHKLIGHAFAYQGLLRISIRSLERIPMEFRVGRRVKGPGDIVIYVDNKVDVRTQ